MQITLTQPDDWHLHVRDGAALATVVPHSARQFARAIIMPNLQPPVTTVSQALAYRERILAAVPSGYDFRPLMTLYLTDSTSVQDIIDAKQCEHVVACKLYPAGATTNSAAGVTNLKGLYPIFEVMQEQQLPLLIHGEVTDHSVDVFDREAVFIEQILSPLLTQFPALKIVLEHITTKQAVDFVLAATENVAATITAHHLLYNRNALFQGGIRPHYYCLPILKRELHQQALITAATSGHSKFFLGTDSAPHSRNTKEHACGCAGCYTAFAALELYASAFEQANALDKLEAFTSFHGADFYGLPRNTGQITLQRAPLNIPASFNYADDELIPLAAESTLNWCLQER